MITSLTTDKAPAATGAFSQGVTDGKLLFTSGQTHLKSDGTLLEGTIQEKTHQVMKNLQAILLAGDATFDDVVKATIYMTDIADRDAIAEVYATYFEPPFPAREMVGVKELPLGASLEISLIATKNSSHGGCQCHG